MQQSLLNGGADIPVCHASARGGIPAPRGDAILLLLLPLLLLSGCSPSSSPLRHPTTRPTTQAILPRHIIVLGSDDVRQELTVENAGPYRLYASNAPGHLLATARLQSGDTLRFRREGPHFLHAEFAGFREEGSFILPVQEGVEYFWTKDVWAP